MRSQGVDYSDALDLIDRPEEGIYVRAMCDLHEGDLVATIPKHSCLTIKTSGARRLIEAAGLEGYLGLSVALMYEKSLGHESPWFGYLQVLPEREGIPLVWSLEEVDSLLPGTELHKIVKDDKALVYEDWKECILPLLDSDPLELNPYFFGVEQYFAAKSLIASRSFEIDDYHGFGMVPLADLFNHKTGAEDVHFTSLSPHLVPENEAEGNQISDEYENTDDGEQLTPNSQSIRGSSTGSLECSSAIGDDPTVLEMIIVKDVKSGAEVFNTYGLLGNAALLHRYGFTEADNPYDIVNIDLELVLQWSSSLFSSRHSRVRLSMWRRLDYSGCVSQNSEYFEISSNGEPQVELLGLLYVVLLPEEAYWQLDLTVSTTAVNLNEFLTLNLPKQGIISMEKAPERSKDLLLTNSVRSALLSLANIRESLYGSNSMENDIEALKRCCHIRERKFYHSLMLRLSERKILEKLRIYAGAGAQLSSTAKRTSMRKKLKT
ncbi:SET domain-containing protein [Actinidia rufa]|uniref:N-lysine methyltransferase n=1 Tax=Actinidia rufa TaxID=165716 RepID=A0A7J0EJN3_9ERIC|nr:SET domain-containing protein [Actinidia rufa]